MLRRIYDKIIAQPLLWLNSQPIVYIKYGSFLKELEFDYLSPDGRGLSMALELSRLSRRKLIHGKDLLLVGVGNGLESQQWVDFSPAVITGIERDSFSSEWNFFVTKSVSDKLIHADKPTIRFLQADGHVLPFEDCSFDLIASRNVLEHVMNLRTHIADVYRVLRQPGYMYAHIGPLWPTYGGCHVGSVNYEHLELDENSLRDLFGRVTDGEPLWLLRGLLNRLRFNDYMTIFTQFFSVEYLAITLSLNGLIYRKNDPDHWTALRKKYSEQDLLIHSMHILLRK